MDDNPVGSRQVPPKLDSGQRDERSFVVIKYVYEIDYPPGEKRKYLEWVRSIADTLQAPGELKRLASYDNAFSASPHRVGAVSSAENRCPCGVASVATACREPCARSRPGARSRPVSSRTSATACSTGVPGPLPPGSSRTYPSAVRAGDRYSRTRTTSVSSGSAAGRYRTTATASGRSTRTSLDLTRSSARIHTSTASVHRNTGRVDHSGRAARSSLPAARSAPYHAWNSGRCHRCSGTSRSAPVRRAGVPRCRRAAAMVSGSVSATGPGAYQLRYRTPGAPGGAPRTALPDPCQRPNSTLVVKPGSVARSRGTQNAIVSARRSSRSSQVTCASHVPCMPPSGSSGTNTTSRAPGAAVWDHASRSSATARDRQDATSGERGVGPARNTAASHQDGPGRGAYTTTVSAAPVTGTRSARAGPAR